MHGAMSRCETFDLVANPHKMLMTQRVLGHVQLLMNSRSLFAPQDLLPKTISFLYLYITLSIISLYLRALSQK